ncbi:hypothetical protein [Haliangium sp.]|uniref:hypothetical protein n=1 Tax=Haliangium sp. TaxID=2663208 RepID=UPI003D0D4221
MALNRFTVAEMVSITGPWIERGHPEHEALMTLPAIAASMPQVEAAHRGLIEAQVNPAQVRLDEIRAEQATFDRAHDNLARFLWDQMNSYRHLHGDQPLGRLIADIQARLFPDGLNVVRYSYRETGGQAALVGARLTDEHKAHLATIPVHPTGTLMEKVEAMATAAARIGVLEDERLALIRPANLRTRATKARSRWIRVVNVVRATIELESEIAEILTLMLARLATLEAARRVTRGGGEGTEAPADEAERPGDERPGDEPPAGAEVPAAPAAEAGSANT